MYDCINPNSATSCICTPYMGEADFWASLGYLIYDWNIPRRFA
jgi:hypothetical protein